MDKKKLPYKIISDFYNSSSKECTCADKHNDKLYKNSVSIANKGLKKLKSGGIDICLEIESPPSPSNYQRYIVWKKKNVEKPVEKQSIAVEFLCLNGYKIGVDYESYEAIDLVNKIKNDKNEKQYISKLFKNSSDNTNNNSLPNHDTSNNDLEKKYNNSFLLNNNQNIINHQKTDNYQNSDKHLSTNNYQNNENNLNKDNIQIPLENGNNNFKRKHSINIRDTNMYPRLSLAVDNISIIDDNEDNNYQQNNIAFHSQNISPSAPPPPDYIAKF